MYSHKILHVCVHVKDRSMSVVQIQNYDKKAVSWVNERLKQVCSVMMLICFLQIVALSRPLAQHSSQVINELQHMINISSIV